MLRLRPLQATPFDVSERDPAGSGGWQRSSVSGTRLSSDFHALKYLLAEIHMAVVRHMRQIGTVSERRRFWDSCSTVIVSVLSIQ